MLEDLLLLLDKVLDDASSAKHMALIAGGGLDEFVGAEGAHFELLDGVLADSFLFGAVDALEFLFFCVGENRG